MASHRRFDFDETVVGSLATTVARGIQGHLSRDRATRARESIGSLYEATSNRKDRNPPANEAPGAARRTGGYAYLDP